MTDPTQAIHEQLDLAANIELLLTRNEYAFQRVLDDAKTSKRFYVVTWAILNGDKDLLHHIREHRADRTSVIICRIPSRRDSYGDHDWSDENRAKARKDIDEHFRRLAPETLPPKTSVYFNHHNHSKIVATENIAYIGSANFTPGTKANYEAGILLTDPEQIAAVLNALLPKLMAEVDAYQDLAASKLAAEIGDLLGALQLVYSRALEGLSRSFDHGFRDDWKGIVYDSFQAVLSDSDRRTASMLAEDAEDLASRWATQYRYRPALGTIDLVSATSVREAAADKRLRELCDNNTDSREDLAEAAEEPATKFVRSLHALIGSLENAHAAAVALKDQKANLNNTKL